MTVITVLGLVDEAELGHIQPHEHILVDCRSREARTAAREAPCDEITLANYYDTRRDHSEYSHQLLSREDAIEELHHFAASGGRTVVDLTNGGLGRDPEGLVAVSAATGVHIVMGCGYYVDDYHPPFLRERSTAELVDEILAEVEDGVGESRVRPGIIGEIGMSWPPTPAEEKVLESAAIAQRQTGLALNIHPGRHEQAPLEHVKFAVKHGADATRVVVSHLDRTLFSFKQMLELAAEGVYLEFDLFGQESSYYNLADIDMPNDAQRVHYLRELIAAGHRDQLLISQDISNKTNTKKYGGEGYDHLLRRVIPLMKRRGLSDDDIRHLTRENPARMLAVRTQPGTWNGRTKASTSS